MKRFSLSLLLLLAAPHASAQKAPVPELLKRAFTAPASQQLYAYDFEDVSDGGSAKEQRKSTVRGHVDPSRKKGDRVTITFAEQTGGKPADLKKLDERYERNADGDIFCDSLSENSVTNVVDKGSTPEGHVFSFTPKAKSDADGQMKDVMKKMTAMAVIDETTSALRSFNAILTKTHNIMLVADLKAASMNVICALAPNGRAYANQVEFIVSGSGMGQAFQSKSVQKISNITPVG
jgi:hypothetical protein